MIEIEASFSRLEFQLAKLADAAKVGLGLVIKEEAKYAIQTIVKFTPPKSKQQGANAVRADFSRLAEPLVYQDLQAKATKGGFYNSMARYVRNRQVEKHEAASPASRTIWRSVPTLRNTATRSRAASAGPSRAGTRRRKSPVLVTRNSATSSSRKRAGTSCSARCNPASVRSRSSRRRRTT